MDKKAYRQAFKEAVSQITEDQIKQIKDLVKTTLEKLQAKEKERQTVVKAIQLLKKDLDDLREGRLDHIKERHGADKEADKVSPISPQTLEKIIISSPTLWQQQTSNWQSSNAAITSTIDATGTAVIPANMGTTFALNTCGSSIAVPLTLNTNCFGDAKATGYSGTDNCFSTQEVKQLFHNACTGTYVLEDGTIKYF